MRWCRGIVDLKPLCLPPKAPGAFASVTEDESVFDALVGAIRLYAQSLYQSETDQELYLFLFPKLVDNGFYRINVEKNGAYLRVMLELWGALSETYFPGDALPPNELGILEGMVEYYMAVN